MIAIADQELTSRGGFSPTNPTTRWYHWGYGGILLRNTGVVPKSFIRNRFQVIAPGIEHLLNKLASRCANLGVTWIHQAQIVRQLRARNKRCCKKSLTSWLCLRDCLRVNLTFSHRDKDNQFHTESGLTPQASQKICRPSIRRLRLYYHAPNYRQAIGKIFTP